MSNKLSEISPTKKEYRIEGINWQFNDFCNLLGRDIEIVNSHIAAYGCPAYMILKLTDTEAKLLKGNHYFNIY